MIFVHFLFHKNRNRNFLFFKFLVDLISIEHGDYIKISSRTFTRAFGFLLRLNIGIVFQPTLSELRCFAGENRCRSFDCVKITVDAAILSASSVPRAKQKYWDTLTLHADAFLQKKTTVFGNKNRNIQILVVCPQFATIKISQYKLNCF